MITLHKVYVDDDIKSDTGETHWFYVVSVENNPDYQSHRNFLLGLVGESGGTWIPVNTEPKVFVLNYAEWKLFCKYLEYIIHF